MTTKLEINGSDLATVNAALSISVTEAIRSQNFAAPNTRRVIPFAAIDAGIEAAERLHGAHGATPLPFTGPFRDTTAAGILEVVRGVADMAAEYRPKRGERRA